MLPKYQKPGNCAGCALEHSGRGFAPHIFPDYAKIMIVGEALGEAEVIQGAPFQGGAGAVLSRVLHMAGVDRSSVAIANVVSCSPPGNALAGMSYEFAATTQCRQYLQPYLNKLPDGGVIVPTGGIALEAIMLMQGAEGMAVKDWHHTVSRSPDGRHWVVPTFHPSHLQRGAMNLLQVVVSAVVLADRISKQGFTRSPAQIVVTPDPAWFTWWVQDHLAKVVAAPDSTFLALDTEFPEKAGVDESEVALNATISPITQVNFSNDGVLGFTVPYRAPYIKWIEFLLRGLAAQRGIVFYWNKYADVDHLKAAGHTLTGIMGIDMMWAWHYLQSDLPRGLGFVAAMASDFGPWKHWSKIKEKEGDYAAADGLQTYRTSMWIMRALIDARMWDVFLRDWHDRDQYVLRPAHEMGVPIDKPALVAFHETLQKKAAIVLERLKATAAEGSVRPKAGYTKRPRGPMLTPPTCSLCGAEKPTKTHTKVHQKAGQPATIIEATYATATPPSTILGKPKRGGGEAKQAYLASEVKLVERTIDVIVHVCTTCGANPVTKTHRCKSQATRRSRRKHDDGTGSPDRSTVRDQNDPSRISTPADQTGASTQSIDGRGTGDTCASSLRTERCTVTRWFWQLPFNPDAPQQVLAYIESQGIEAPFDRKRQRKTTNKTALADLAKRHRDMPFFQAQLDWKAVTKVDSTYVVQTMVLMDQDDRIHPEFLPKPSTLRDSSVKPNLQNVVADKTGPEALAAGFRVAVVARDGLPPGVDEGEYQRWYDRWVGQP